MKLGPRSSEGELRCSTLDERDVEFGDGEMLALYTEITKRIVDTGYSR